MRSLFAWLALALGALTMTACGEPGTASDRDAAETERPRYALAIHGGAGVIERGSLDAATEAAYRSALEEALAAGERILDQGGSAVDAVIAAIVVMEDSELFNAGRGAVLTHEGTVELDASLMRGEDLDAGAVAGVTRVRHPILAARAVMERSPHVLLAGVGADRFAAEMDLELMDNSWFRTDRRRQQLERALEEDRVRLDHDDGDNLGTVGAVALDADGNLAAGTSTGGMTNKRWGRVGDSPLIGAGTFASNASCAVSATGHGEYFIRRTVAREVCALMEHAGLDLASAARRVVHEQLLPMGGSGGVIAVDHRGNVALEMNTPGMYRASVRAGEEPLVAIYGR